MRTWTAPSIAEFEKDRHHYLTQVEQPPLLPWSTFAEDEKVKYLAGQRHKVVAEEFSRLTVGGWALGKRPMAAYRAPTSGTLFLPRGMNGKEGFDRASFDSRRCNESGESLMQFVFICTGSVQEG